MSTLKLTQQAETILTRRYLARNSNGKVIEDFEGLFRRVAYNLALVEHNYCSQSYGPDPTNNHDSQACPKVQEWGEKFYELLTSLDFLPNTPTLINAGRPLGQLSACFVLPIPDSLEGIYERVKQTVLIHRTGGGTGFSFSKIRPRGDVVASTGQDAAGPIGFMKVFDAATEQIKQSGVRRGANMGMLRFYHPYIH